MNWNLNFRHFRGLHSFMYCELIFVLVVLLIDIPLSLSLGYQSQMYSMHDPNQCYPLVLNNSQFSCFNYRQDITYMRLALPKNGSSMFGLGLPLQPRPGPLTWLFPQGEPIYSASASSAEGTVIPLPANPPLPLWVPWETPMAFIFIPEADVFVV